MGFVPDELTPTALAKVPSWALVQELSQERRDAIHDSNATYAFNRRIIQSLMFDFAYAKSKIYATDTYLRCL